MVDDKSGLCSGSPFFSFSLFFSLHRRLGRRQTGFLFLAPNALKATSV